jgi:hypothetical protein
VSENIQCDNPVESTGPDLQRRPFHQLKQVTVRPATLKRGTGWCLCPYAFDRHRSAVMSRNDWLELVQLAEILCPHALLDLPLLVDMEAYGLLLWLRGTARGQSGVQA